MPYLTLIKLLGVIVLLIVIYKGTIYFTSYTFFKKLDEFIEKDLNENDVKYMTNEVNKYKPGRNSFNWDVMARAVLKVEQSDADLKIKETFYEIVSEKGLMVDKVLEEYKGE